MLLTSEVWLTAGPEPGHLAVVTETGSAASVTESAGQIWAEFARRYGPSLVLLEHHPAPGAGEGAETLDLVRIGADGSPHWLSVWPTTEDNPATPGSNCGWRFTGTGSPASPRAGSARASTRKAELITPYATSRDANRHCSVPRCGVNDLSVVVRMVAREPSWLPYWLPTTTVIQPCTATSGLVILAQTTHPASPGITQPPSGID